jgi:hypothetical protein
MKIRPVGSEMIHADRQMDGRTGMTKSLFAIVKTHLKMKGRPHFKRVPTNTFYILAVNDKIK